LCDDGAVRVTWVRADARPFELSAVYRWRDAATLDVETLVTASEPLDAFESFLAVYCDASLPSPYVHVGDAAEDGFGFVNAPRSAGDWQTFPRDADAVDTIGDTRWDKLPHPVAWTVRGYFDRPLAFRCGDDGPAVVVMAPKDDCFAIMTPYDGEGHYSLYLSLFGGDVAAGQTVQAKARLVVTSDRSPAAITALYDNYLQDLAR